MLSYLNNFIVPGAPHVVVFPDHENPYKFYCYRNVPKITKDSSGAKTPLFHYTSMARAASHAKGENASLGFLNMTVDIGPTEEEYAIIKKYIEQGMKNNDALFSGMSKLYPLHKGYKGATQVVFGTPKWEKGIAQLFLFDEGDSEGILKATKSKEITPALSGHCHATFTETFREEGDILMHNFIEEQIQDKELITQASVRYTLEGVAYIPALNVDIVIHLQKGYSYLKTLKDTLDKTRNGGIHEESGPGYYKRVDSRGLYCTREELNNMVRDYKNTGFISINIDDLSGFSSEEEAKWTDQILESYLNTISGNILPKLFTEAKELETGTEPQEQTGEYDPNRPDDQTKVTDKELDRPNVKVVYRFEDKVSSEELTDIQMKLSKSSTKVFTESPQGLLTLQDLTAQQKNSLVSIVQLQDNVHEYLYLPVQVFAEFEEDHIAEVQVNVVYDHFNETTHKQRYAAQTYCFHSIGESYSFDVTKARDKSGNFISKFKYRTKVIFKNESSGANDKWSDWIETEANPLSISYGTLGYFHINVSGGNFDNEYLKEAVVNLQYLGAPGYKDTSTEIHLTPDSPAKSWKCPRYRSTDDRYQYAVTYRYLDGSEYQVDQVEDILENLVVLDPFDAITSLDFSARVGQGILQAIVEVRMTDGSLVKTTKHEIAPGQSLDTWQWTARTRRGTNPKIEYRTIVLYGEGKPVESGWTRAKDNFVYLELSSDPNAKPEPIEESSQIQLITSGINWEKWGFVFVIVEDDTKKKRTIQISPDSPITPIDVTYSSEGNGTCKLAFKFVSNAPVKSIDVPAVECSESVFVVTEPQDE